MKLRMAIMGLAGLAATSASLAAPPTAVAYERLQRCPFSAADLSTATGLKVELVELPQIAGAPPPMTKPRDGQMFLSCSAVDGAAAANLLITQRWFEPKSAAARIQALRLRDLKAAQPIANDPDGALYLSERNGAKQGLHYVRGGNVLVSISINSIPQNLQAGLRDKLTQLRRQP